MVTGISHGGGECFAVSYGDINEEGRNKNDYEAGLTYLWDYNINNKPKNVLLSPSVVTSSLMDPNDHNLVYGGLANGLLAMWDVRAKKLPVMTSKYTEQHRHTLHVNSLNLTKWKNERCLMSSSFDGKVMIWDLKEFKLLHMPDHLGDYTTLTAFAVPHYEPD